MTKKKQEILTAVSSMKEFPLQVTLKIPVWDKKRLLVNKTYLQETFSSILHCKCVSNEVSALVLTGQMLSLGVPSISMMSSIWWMSDLPGSRGRWASSSPNIHPVDLLQQVTHVLLLLLGSEKIWIHQCQNFGHYFNII